MRRPVGTGEEGPILRRTAGGPRQRFGPEWCMSPFDAFCHLNVHRLPPGVTDLDACRRWFEREWRALDCGVKRRFTILS